MLHLLSKITLANLRSWCSKRPPISGYQLPDLRTCLMETPFVLCLQCEMHVCRASSNAPRLPWFWNCCKTPTLGSLLTRCRIHCACRAKPHPDLKNCSKTISFYHFWLPNVFLAKATCTFSAPQLPQKCSEHEVLCTFWLRNVLRATAACILSTAHLPKVFQTRLFKHFGLDVHFVNRSPAKSAPDVWCFLAFLTSKSASRHTGVQFFISSRQTTPHPPLQWAFRSHKN